MNKSLLGVLLLIALSSVCALTEDEYHYLYAKWISQHHKKYSVDQFVDRFPVFRANLDFVVGHNQGNHSYTVAMNAFGDLTSAEFAQRNKYNNIQRDYLRSQNVVHDRVIRKPADSLDWRAKGAVTPIKDQGQCGSCWAFSTTGSVEGAYQIATGTLVSLSEQELVDCSSAQGNEGCNGGLMDWAFEYIIKSGICSEASYPYKAQDGTCKKVASVVKITGYKDVTTQNEAALMTAVNLGPVSIAIEADQSAFQFYSGGVFDDASCGTSLDHGVLVVGYNTAGTQDYWIVKNSWGTSWGAQGYIYMIRNKNECGLAMEPSYPTGAGPAVSL